MPKVQFFLAAHLRRFGLLLVMGVSLGLSFLIGAVSISESQQVQTRAYIEQMRKIIEQSLKQLEDPIKQLFGGSPSSLPEPTAILTAEPMAIGTPTHDPSIWQTYVNSQYGYEVKYPTDWTVSEAQNATRFAPPGIASDQHNISIVIIDYSKTPPPPVNYQYTPVRTIQWQGQDIQVRKRTPAPVIEEYFAVLPKADNPSSVAEVRFSLDRSYDAYFDKMISTFRFTQ
jgi:hypothetical protein